MFFINSQTELNNGNRQLDDDLSNKKNIEYYNGQTDLMSVQVDNFSYVMSYYYDERVENLIVLLYNDGPFKRSKCNITYEGDIVEKCNYILSWSMTESHTLSYIYIPLTHDNPKYFYLSDHKFDIFKKIYTPKDHHKLTLCICKMIKFKSPYSFIQMIEANRYFGVDHFTVYKTSCNKKMDAVLNYYTNIGLMEVVKWNKTIEVGLARNFTYAQRNKLNDCLYRNRKTSDDLLNSDSDEILWPVIDEKLPDLFKRLDSMNLINDVYFLRERIFKRDFINAFDRYTHNISDCNFFKYRRYADYIWTYPKYYVRGLDKMKTLDIHYIYKTLKNITSTKIPTNIAYIRHTRRVYPWLMQYSGRWMDSEEDYREKYIQENVEKVRTELNIKKPE